MAKWTKSAAIDRGNRNRVLQEALRLEPRLEAIIEEAQSQRRAKGYNRIRKYIELRNKVIPLVGSLAKNPALNRRDYYDAVRETIDDLLPPDEVDIYSEGKSQTHLQTSTNVAEQGRSEREKMSRSLRLTIL